ncbi:MAG: TMEM175 family protein [Actinomycetes bacterium]
MDALSVLDHAPADGRRAAPAGRVHSAPWPPFSPPACLARAGEIGYDRVLFFSDAIFAIAITLLIVDLQVPDVPNLQSGTQLRESIPRMAGFALSFAAAGLAEAAVWLCAIHIRDLRPARRPPLVHRWVLLRILPAPAVFLLSIPFAIRQPVLASTCGSSPS